MQLNKKVLVISSWAPPEVSGSAHLFYNLFSRIDTSAYCVFTSRRNFSNSDTSSGQILKAKYYFFEDDNIFKIPMFPFTYTPETPLWTKIYQKIRRGVLKTCRTFAMIKNGLKIIREEKIQVLVGTSDIGRSMLLTFTLSKLSRKPYLLLLFDLYRENQFPFPWTTVARLTERTLFKNAAQVATITEEIRDLYVSRYGERRKYRVINQCVDESRYEQARAMARPEDKAIVFTGSIYWAQQKSILSMVQAVNTMTDKAIRFIIYTPEISTASRMAVSEFNSSGRTEIRTAPPSDIPLIQCSAGALFIPLAWKTTNQDVVTNAIPYKLFEYLAAKRPIIIHAPSGSLNRYARQEGFAHIVDQEDTKLLQESIDKIFSDKAYAKRLAAAALRTFERNHQASSSAAALKKIIESTLI